MGQPEIEELMSAELGLVSTPDLPTFIRQGTLRRLAKMPTVWVSVVILGTVLFYSFFGAILAPFDPNFTKLDLVNIAPFQSEYLLGGDRSGTFSAASCSPRRTPSGALRSRFPSP